MRVLPNTTGGEVHADGTGIFALPSPTPFQTYLQLTPEREEMLAERIGQRITEISREMGLQVDGTVDTDSFLGVRERYQQIYDHDLEWRKGLDSGGTVFSQVNRSFGTAKRYAREMSAKMSDDLIGTTPFFTAVKRRPNDGALARGIEELIQTELMRTNMQDEIRTAQRTGCVRNECVVKIRYALRTTPYVGPADVMVDPQTGTPIATPSGYMIYQGDDFLPVPKQNADDPDEPQMMMLKKDPLFRMEPNQFPIRHFDRLPQTLEEHEGVELSTVDYRSFLCPLNAPDIHSADLVAQLFDETYERLHETYGGFASWESYASNRATSGEQQPKTAHREQDDKRRSSVIRTRSMAEVYLRYDADGDGMEEEIMAIYDREDKKLVFYEYRANQMKTRPFEVIVGIERVENRWYGVGILEMLYDLDLYIDTQFCRGILKDSRSSSATFFDPTAVRLWNNGAQPVFGTNAVYAVQPGFDRDNRPAVWRVNLDEQSKLLMELIEMVQRETALTFGVVNSKDASAVGLNQSRTATGILNLERTSNIILKYSEVEQRKGILAILAQCVDVALENLHDMELVASPDGAILLSINKHEARDIEKEITLMLTRSRSTEMLSSNQQALQIAKDYHAMRQQNPEMLTHIRPLYISQLKSLECPDPDSLCPEVTPEEIQQWQASQQQRQQDELKHQFRENMSYKDTPPVIQAQMEIQAGMKPATDADREQHVAMQAAAKSSATKQPEPKPK